MMNQNSRIQNQLQDFSTKVAPVKPVDASQPDRQVIRPEEKIDDGVSLKLSQDGDHVRRIADRDSTLSNSFTSSNFSTGKEAGTPKEATEAAADTAGNSVLNQYRFFVQSSQYEDADGVVRRIFR